MSLSFRRYIQVKFPERRVLAGSPNVGPRSQRSKLTFSKGCLLATFNCKMVAIKKYSVAKKKENVKGRTLHDILHVDKKGKTLHDKVHEGLMRRTARFYYSKFTHSC